MRWKERLMWVEMESHGIAETAGRKRGVSRMMGLLYSTGDFCCFVADSGWLCWVILV